MTRRWLANGLALAVLWLFVRGVDPTPLPSGLVVIAEELVIGLLVGLPTAFALRAFYADEFAVRPSLRVVPYAARYIAVFVRELLTANVDVAYRVLAPSMPIEPDVVAVPLRVESDAAITTIANSITLTPGTLTMDHDAETNTLYVHAINCQDHASVVAPIRTWEDYALVIFEGRDPSTPVPGPDPGQPSADGGTPGAAANGGESDGE
ncbi:Na+/H+ antiporter subunit E [Haloglomus salinum]|jgi:multicomponent Na+:H+ antiporter subunit E|uniref:Na+/H+ antiporter subunit E n=1 Tax=Haloglomus salinum TaxID=2962673 RepID=UPI0020C9C1FA|nr:Na+/H+ antiporter subunit E [Haloglomus salinum]